jgi:hypothetical protein
MDQISKRRYTWSLTQPPLIQKFAGVPAVIECVQLAVERVALSRQKGTVYSPALAGAAATAAVTISVATVAAAVIACEIERLRSTFPPKDMGDQGVRARSSGAQTMSLT